MRCLSCNESLTDLESVRRFPGSGTYSDLCESCFNTVCADLLELEVVSAIDSMEGLSLDADGALVASSLGDAAVGDVGDEGGEDDNG